MDVVNFHCTCCTAQFAFVCLKALHEFGIGKIWDIHPIVSVTVLLHPKRNTTELGGKVFARFVAFFNSHYPAADSIFPGLILATDVPGSTFVFTGQSLLITPAHHPVNFTQYCNVHCHSIVIDQPSPFTAEVSSNVEITI